MRAEDWHVPPYALWHGGIALEFFESVTCCPLMCLADAFQAVDASKNYNGYGFCRTAKIAFIFFSIKSLCIIFFAYGKLISVTMDGITLHLNFLSDIL